MKAINVFLVALVCGLPCIGNSNTEEKGEGFDPRLSTDQAENQIAMDKASNPLYESRMLAPISDWRDELAGDTGFQWSLDYSSQFMQVNKSLGDKDASGGMVRFFGSWNLVGDNPGNHGSLLWKVEHRHSYTDLPVSGLGFESGYVGLFAPPFSDQGTRLTNLYWKQKFSNGKGTVVAGLLDITDFLDVYLLASPWTGFNNFVFSTGNAAIDLPNDSAFGVLAGYMISDNFYAHGGFTDTSSDPTDPFDSLDNFFSHGNTFKYIEFGWTPGPDKLYFDNAHVTIWQIDERENGTPDGWGVAVSYQRWIDDKWLPFVRGSYTEDSGSLLETSVSVGLGYQPVPMRGVIGIGLNWGQPNETSFGDLDDQITAEAYWRYQLSKEIAITPSIQYIDSPAQNPDANNLWAFGLRVRVAL